jgi:hypothetical protein
MLQRFFSRLITLGIFRPWVPFPDLDGLAIHADPAGLTIPERFFAGRITLAAIRAWITCTDLDRLSIHADPTRPWATRQGVLLGSITLASLGSRVAFAHLNRLSIQTDPTRPAAPERFFLRPIALAAFRARVGRADLDCFAVYTDPTGLAFLLGKLFCRIAFAVLGSGIPLWDLDNYSVDANPAKLRNTTVPLCLFGRIKTLASALPTVVFWHLNQYFSVGSLEAAPAQLNAILEGVRGRRETFEPERGCVRLGTLYRLAVHAVPALNRDTILLRFLFGRVTFASLFLAIGPGRLEYFSVDATPEARLAIPNRFFFGREAGRPRFLRVCSDRLNDLPIGTSPTRFAAALRFAGSVKTGEAFCLTIGPGRLDSFLIQTIPAWPATLDRLFRRTVTLTAIRLTFGRQAQVDVTFDTGVAPIRQV